MKRYVLITTIFALFTVASFEAARQSYKLITDKVVIDLSSLVEASRAISDVQIATSKSDRAIDKNSYIEKKLNAKFRISMKRFNRRTKKKNAVIIVKAREKNLSNLELNNEKLISLKGYEVPVVKTFVVASLLNGFSLPVDNQFNVHTEKVEKVAAIKDRKVEVIEAPKEDKVSINLSATEKLKPNEEALINELVNNVDIQDVIAKKDKEKKKEVKEEKSDEMIFFDYSNKKKEEVAAEVSKPEIKNEAKKQVIAMSENPLKEEVLSMDEAMSLLPIGKKVIAEVGSQNRVTTQKESSPAIAMNTKPDYSQLVQASLSAPKKNSYPSNAKLTVRTSLGIIGKGLQKNTTPFQFVSDVSFGEPMSSGSIGAIEIEDMINEKVSTIRGTILSLTLHSGCKYKIHFSPTFSACCSAKAKSLLL